MDERKFLMAELVIIHFNKSTNWNYHVNQF